MGIAVYLLALVVIYVVFNLSKILKFVKVSTFLLKNINLKKKNSKNFKNFQKNFFFEKYPKIFFHFFKDRNFKNILKSMYKNRNKHFFQERMRLYHLMSKIDGPLALPLLGTTFQFKMDPVGEVFF